MNNAILMSLKEPNDHELISLMKEVASDAKQKAIITQNKLTEKIIELVKNKAI